MLPAAATSFVSSIIAKADSNSRIRRFVDMVLDDDKARDLILHRLGTRQIHDASLIDKMVPGVKLDTEFADLLWLLSSNYANRGMALLMLEEAIWLYDTVKATQEPRVAELGRAKGGTTFLLAASGATVLSIENGALEESNARHYGKSESSYDGSLARALSLAGLADRVQMEVDDAETFEVEPAVFDLVFSDIVLPLDRMVSLFDRWWKGVKPDGRLVLRDGREPRTPSVGALVDELRGRADLRFEEPAPGVFTVLVKVQA